MRVVDMIIAFLAGVCMTCVAVFLGSLVAPVFGRAFGIRAEMACLRACVSCCNVALDLFADVNRLRCGK